MCAPGNTVLNAAYVWTNQQPPKSVAGEIQDAQKLSNELMSPEQSEGNGDTQAGRAQAAASKMQPEGKAASNTATAPKDAAQCVDKFGQTIESAQSTLNKSDQASAGT